LQALPEGFRIAIYLADVEDVTYKGTRRPDGLPIGTVMSRLHGAADNCAKGPRHQRFNRQTASIALARRIAQASAALVRSLE
jgi:DNA-directed RNA polymerase specialized sigma24 family protein